MSGAWEGLGAYGGAVQGKHNKDDLGHLRGVGDWERLRGHVGGRPGCPWGHGLIRWPGHLQGCGRLGTSTGACGGKAWVPVGAWSRANIIRWPGHLRGCGRLRASMGAFGYGNTRLWA